MATIFTATTWELAYATAQEFNGWKSCYLFFGHPISSIINKMVRCWFNLQTTTYVAFFFPALRDCSLAANKRKDHLINHVEYFHYYYYLYSSRATVAHPFLQRRRDGCRGQSDSAALLLFELTFRLGTPIPRSRDYAKMWVAKNGNTEELPTLFFFLIIIFTWQSPPG